MFFYLSKILWALVAPSTFIGILVILGAIALLRGRWRGARWFIVPAAGLYFLFGIMPLGLALLRPLEDRFPVLDPAKLNPTGIIVLGGGVDETLSKARGTTELSEAGSRMTEAVALARRFPNARIVFTGGTAALRGSDITESDIARRLFLGLGLDEKRMTFEDKSRNTHENAEFTKRIVEPKPGEQWLLVTSAYHMPRSMGIFRKANFDVVPFPVDFTSLGDMRDFLRPSAEARLGLKHTDRAVREWIGLVAYYLTGKTNELLPGP